MNRQLKQAACPSSRDRLGDNRLHDGSPTDVHGGVVVGGSRVSARLAEKVVSILSVGLLTVSALRTCARRVAGVHEVNQNTGEQRLVLNKTSKLKVAPGFVSRSLRLPNRGPSPDALKVFETYGSVRVFSLAYKRLTDAVVEGFVSDHINGNTLDNRKENLRWVTPSQSCMNRGTHANNTSGVKGVRLDGVSGKWDAYIGVRGKCVSLGKFDTKDEAKQIRLAAEKVYFGPHSRK